MADQRPQTYPFGELDRLELHPRYRELRDRGELARITMPFGGDAWLATTYDQVRAVLTDPRFSRTATIGQDVPRPIPMIMSDPSILSMDPPEHTRLRRVLGRAFTPRRIEELRPRTEQVVDELLDGILAQGPPADLIESLALPLPTTIICALLGVPFADRDQFWEWSFAALAITGYDPAQMEAARDALVGYLGGLLEERSKQPTGDLLTALAQARDEGGLTNVEAIIFGITLLGAGFETTANQIGNFVYLLLTHPEQLKKLQADPALLPGAIEELLRFAPLGATAQSPALATEDVVIGEVTVRAGEAVLIHLAAANRDGREFENPDDLDLSREHNAHVAFGHGAHHCIGAQLARLELQVAMGAVIRRLPGLRFAGKEEELPFRSGRLARGLEALPVTWD